MKLLKSTVGIFFSVLLLVVFFGVSKTHASGSNMYGYAWSSNIGWVKLNNCDDPTNPATCSGPEYGVTIPTTSGALSGYAWSSNIGWISFNNTGCPSNDVLGCTGGAKVVWASDKSATLSGWAQACAVYASGCGGALADNTSRGDWDGYIRLDGVKIAPDGTMAGYAWGSTVVGWLQFSHARISRLAVLDVPTLTLTAVPATITSGQNATLSAQAKNITGICTGTWPGGAISMTDTAGIWKGSVSVQPTSTKTYTINCKGTNNQPIAASATVTVTGGGTTQCSDKVDNADPEDNYIDATDPGCHSDGNANNVASYDPNDDNEVNPVCPDGSPVPGDGGCPIKNPIFPTCFDGIKNQNETSVDKGGVCGEGGTRKPQCSDGIDNDKDKFIDFPNDLGCSSKDDDDEYNGGGSDGGVCPDLPGGPFPVIPKGYHKDPTGKCLPDNAKDWCANIIGDQQYIPKGYNVDKYGNCRLRRIVIEQ